MPLIVWFFAHVFLTLALGARNSVVAGAAPANPTSRIRVGFGFFLGDNPACRGRESGWTARKPL